jgi:hypothetical protein
MRQNARMAKNPAHPPHVRAAALEYAAEHSFNAASKEFNIPAPTIRSWARRAGHLKPQTGVEVVWPTDDRGVMIVPWSERRDQLISMYGNGASAAGQAALEAIESGRAKDARDLAVTSGIMTDKALLIAGYATSRTESRNQSISFTGQLEPAQNDAKLAEIDGEIEQLKQELAELGDPDAVERLDTILSAEED